MIFMNRGSKGFSEEEVEHLAWLARIEISNEEKKLFTHQLSIILDYFYVIDTVDTKDITPTLHILDITNVFREDIVKDSIPNDEALTNATIKEKGYFKAPKIV